MATVTTGVGLFSGLDYASLVNQLIAIDARPRDQLIMRMGDLDAQRTAYLDISARLTALLSRVETLTKPSFFRSVTANSSNADVLSVTASAGALPGSYSFVVRSLATTHQLISRGYTSRDAAVPPGSFTLESSQARVNRETMLDELNGFTGVQRGSFKIIDGDGEEAVVSIIEAQTVGDVIEQINAADVGVQAELRGESIVLSDTTGEPLGVRIREEGDGHTAADLGFAPGNTHGAGGELVGTDLIYLADTTLMSALNDGLGVRRAVAGTDFTIQSSNTAIRVDVRLSEIIRDDTRLERLNHARGVELGSIRITTKDNVTTEVDLSGAETIGDVKQAIEDAVDGVAVVLTGGRLVISDTTGETLSDLAIEDVDGHAARDLGILDSSEGDKIDGRQILHVDTLGDIVAAINYGAGNQYDNGTPIVEASIDSSGTRLLITDRGEGFPVTVLTANENSQALFDLGFEPGGYGSFGAEIVGDRIIGGIDTVMLSTLNGGSGYEGGTIHIAANGAEANVDLTNAETLRDAIEQINAASEQFSLGIEAGYDSTGTRLLITNQIEESGLITITDVDGNFAESVGIAGSDSRIRGVNLQRQYLSELTRLADLSAGNGVSLGTLRIADAEGRVGLVDLVEAGAETLQDVIDAINGLVIGVEARINDTGDGLLITDTSGGAGTLTITEEGGTIARDLNILGEADEQGQIDGAYEFEIEASGNDTLEDLVEQINGTTLASASLINDGSSVAPYRLSIASQVSGRAGELILDGLGSDLDFSTLTRAQDASVLLGNGIGGGILVTSSNNTITGIVEGLTLNLNGVDDDPVTVTVDRDLETMLSTLRGLVQDYNTLMDRIGDLSSYNAETETRGILLGDGTLQIIKNRIYGAFTGVVPGATGTLTRLSQLGVKLGSGARLTLDEDKFREVYEDDPEEVVRFFTAAETGLAIQIKDSLGRMTEAGGLLKRRENALQDRKELLSDRVDQLNELLERKRQRMLREFQAMEQALAQLQSQQTAINNMSLMSWFTGSSSSTFGSG